MSRFIHRIAHILGPVQYIHDDGLGWKMTNARKFRI